MNAMSQTYISRNKLAGAMKNYSIEWVSREYGNQYMRLLERATGAVIRESSSQNKLQKLAIRLNEENN